MLEPQSSRFAGKWIIEKKERKELRMTSRF
jgi:hypothetical protein